MLTAELGPSCSLEVLLVLLSAAGTWLCPHNPGKVRLVVHVRGGWGRLQHIAVLALKQAQQKNQANKGVVRA